MTGSWNPTPKASSSSVTPLNHRFASAMSDTEPPS